MQQSWRQGLKCTFDQNQSLFFFFILSFRLLSRKTLLIPPLTKPHYVLPLSSSMESLLSSPSTQLFPSSSSLFCNQFRSSRLLTPDAKLRIQPLSCTMSQSSQTEEKPKETKLWGGIFEESVTDIVEKFTETISFDKKLYKHDIMWSKAHASMLAKKGLISTSDKDSILQGLDEIQKRIEACEFVWRTDREDVHMNIEITLTDLIGEPAMKLHTARSRNDQVLTDFRLWCGDAIDMIVASIKHLQVELVRLALKNEGLIVPGYTHLQRVQPVLLQHLLIAFSPCWKFHRIGV